MRFWVWAALSVSLCGAVHASDFPSNSASQDAIASDHKRWNRAAASEEMFPRGQWTLELTASYAASVSKPRIENIYSGSVGVGYYFFDRFAIIGSFPGYYIAQDSGSTAGGGFDLMARWHLGETGPLSFYLDGGAGLLETAGQVPVGGTRFNFTPRVGVGATLRLNDQTFLQAGIRAFHVSNAGINGIERNPSIDVAVQGYIGLIFDLK